MTEVLTITQMISEEKAIRQKICNLISTDFKAISYYQKNRPYVGARTVEEQTRDQKEKWQTLQDLFKRLKAIKSAHTRANHTTLVTVPCEPDLAALLRGDDVGMEQITIAEAINRKNSYRTRRGFSESPETMSMESLARNLLKIFNSDFNSKTDYDRRAESEVDQQMARKFPQDSKQNWSQERYNEERKKEQALVEVQRIDPLDLIGSNAIQKFFNSIQDYLSKIDVILSEANASTKVEVEY